MVGKIAWRQRPVGQNNMSSNSESAVLVPLVQKVDGWHVLFEIRNPDLRWQPGDICFPGGRIESYDGDPEVTAVRETVEELGVDREGVTIWGPLDRVVAVIGVNIYPYVGELADQQLSPNHDEVMALFTVPLNWLLAATPRRATMRVLTKPEDNFPWEQLPSYEREWKKRKTYEVYFYEYGEYLIWGLTAQILKNFLEIYREIECDQREKKNWLSVTQ